MNRIDARKNAQNGVAKGPNLSVRPTQGAGATPAIPVSALGSAALKLVDTQPAHLAPRPTVRFIPSMRAAAGVASFQNAATAAGLSFLQMSQIGRRRRAKSETTDEMMAFHLVGTVEQCLSELARHQANHPGRTFVVLGEDEPQLVDACLQAGARGFIPTSYSPGAMGAALTLVREGQIFRPTRNACAPSPLPSSTVAEVGLECDRGMRDYHLTKVEREVLALAAKGHTNHEIAQRRGGREGTIKVHMNHIFTKLNVRTRCEAIAVYLQMHNVDPDELQRMESGTMDMKWLLSTMTHMHCKQGTVLFRRGDEGDRIYFLQHGSVNLQEFGVDMVANDLFGEIGVFAPGHKRSATAVCKTDADLFTLSFDEVRRCYFLNPQFAFYIMYLVTRRLMADRERTRGGR